MTAHYDFSELGRIERFIRMRFPNMEPSAAHAYFMGLPYLERQRRAGFAGSVCVPLTEWAKAAYQSENTAAKALHTLADMGLIDLKLGDSRKRLANTVRRKLIKEIETQLPRTRLNAFIPADAEDLAKKLESHSWSWNGQQETPRFCAWRTGRIYMSNPNRQGSPQSDRIAALRQCLRPGEVLVMVDYKAAEPTILLHALHQVGLFAGEGIDDLYDNLAQIRGIDRKKAKRELLSLLYCRAKTLRVPDAWNVPKQHRLHAFFNAVNEYRERLWRDSRRPREIETLMGRTIKATTREKMHPGILLSWRLQGTVADIFNEALSQIIITPGMRLLLQIHDAVYVAVKAEDAHKVREIMEETARKAGYKLTTTETTHVDGKVSGKGPHT